MTLFAIPADAKGCRVEVRVEAYRDRELRHFVAATRYLAGGWKESADRYWEPGDYGATAAILFDQVRKGHRADLLPILADALEDLPDHDATGEGFDWLLRQLRKPGFAWVDPQAPGAALAELIRQVAPSVTEVVAALAVPARLLADTMTTIGANYAASAASLEAYGRSLFDGFAPSLVLPPPAALAGVATPARAADPPPSAGSCWLCYWGWPRVIRDVYAAHGGDLLDHGPAHVVWGDHNFDDGSIDSCLRDCRADGAGVLYEMTADELATVERSLLALKAVPEPVRECTPQAYRDAGRTRSPADFPPPAELGCEFHARAAGGPGGGS